MNKPNATYQIDAYRFSWPEEEVDILVDRLHQEKTGLQCEMTVNTSRAPTPGLLRQGNFNLSSTTARSQWQRALSERLEDVDWYACLEQVCSLTLRRWRDGTPAVRLADVEPRHQSPYLLHPLVVDNAPTILFADGGTGKSLLALAVAVTVASGEPVLGLHSERLGPVLYLDYEWDENEHSSRLRAICNAHGIDVPADIHYRREHAPLVEAAASIRRVIAELGIELVIVDSLGFARGGEPESADLTLKVFGAMRTFEKPVLICDHITKNGTDRKHSFGSVYSTNAARLTWRADAVKDEGGTSITVGLTNAKTNGRYQKPRGYRIDLETDEMDMLVSCRFSQVSIDELPDLSSKTLSMRDHIAGILRANRGEPLLLEDIVTALQSEGAHWGAEGVKVCMYRNKGMFVHIGGNKWALKAVQGEPNHAE